MHLAIGSRIPAQETCIFGICSSAVGADPNHREAQMARLMQWELVIAIGSTMLGVNSQTRAQCGEWFPGDGIPGVNGSVYAVTTWDPDGAGPLFQWMVIGGTFTYAGDALVANIAAWDGQHWHS